MSNNKKTPPATYGEWECKPVDGGYILTLNGVGVVYGTHRDVINTLRRWRY